MFKRPHTSLFHIPMYKRSTSGKDDEDREQTPKETSFFLGFRLYVHYIEVEWARIDFDCENRCYKRRYHRIIFVRLLSVSFLYIYIDHMFEEIRRFAIISVTT